VRADGHGHRSSLDFDRDSEALVDGDATEAGDVAEDTGHVRFASAPEVVSVNVDVEANEGVHERDQDGAVQVLRDATGLNPFTRVEDPVEATEGADESIVEEPEMQYTESDPLTSTSTSSSDGAPDASMEAQPRSADTTITLAEVDVAADDETLASPPPTEEFQSEPDSLTVISSTPPPSNPDAGSTYASSSGGSAPTSTGYYASTPSWMPPYTMPQNPYAPYGYYPQQVAGQPGADGASAYPWMAVYRVRFPRSFSRCLFVSDFFLFLERHAFRALVQPPSRCRTCGATSTSYGVYPTGAGWNFHPRLSSGASRPVHVVIGLPH